MNYKFEIEAQVKKDKTNFAFEAINSNIVIAKNPILKFIAGIIKHFLELVQINSRRRLKLKQDRKIVNGKIVSLLNHIVIQRAFKVENILDERNIMINYSPHLGFLFMIHLN
jgi:hypothetical protein